MRAAIKTFKTVLVVSLAAAGGCEQSQPDQNITIDNAAPADIETLPADESSATDFENGADNADVTDLNTTNSE
jgi:hypothetical protein